MTDPEGTDVIPAANPSLSPASTEAESPVLQWAQLTPYLSLRLFELSPATPDWTEDAVRIATDLAQQLPALVQHYPPKKRRGRTTPSPGTPQSVQEIAASFFDIASGNLESSVDLERAPEIPGLARELALPHIFLAGVWYRTSGPPPWLRRGTGTQPPEIEDVRHQLVLVAMMPPYVGVTTTHPPMHELVSAFLVEGRYESLILSGTLSPVRNSQLESAFVRGEAFHLWLAGLHRSVLTKADKKTLAGRDLRHALDPYAEQTYAYSAIVSRLALTEEKLPVKQTEEEKRIANSVGFSRTTKAVWTSKTAGIIEFGKRFAVFRELLLEGVRAGPARRRTLDGFGLSYLSQPIGPLLLDEAKQPFEISLDLGDPDPGGEAPETELRSAREEWRAHGSLELCREDDPDLPEKPAETAGENGAAADRPYRHLSVRALYDGRPVAYFWLAVAPGRDEELAVTVPSMRPLPEAASVQAFEPLDELLRDDRRVAQAFVVRFESGHVLSGTKLYKPDYQDVLFKSSEWRPLALVLGTRAFDASKEKPEKWDRLRACRAKLVELVKPSDSLFSYIAHCPESFFQPAEGREWHVLCHDQANEVADFVYIEPDGRRISLVHVKGANKTTLEIEGDDEKAGGKAEREKRRGASPKRRVSIDAYQVVLQQAVKNLRHLNAAMLEEKILGERTDADTTASDRECGIFRISSDDPTDISFDCGPFARALRRLTDAPLPVIDKKVIVLQPHVRLSLWKELEETFLRVHNPKDERELQPALMLSSLLISTEIACRKLGVELEVCCEDDLVGPAVAGRPVSAAGARRRSKPGGRRSAGERTRAGGKRAGDRQRGPSAARR